MDLHPFSRHFERLLVVCALVAVFVVNDYCVQTKISFKKENKLSIFIMDSINQTALMDSLNQTAIMEVEDYEFNSFLFWLGLFGLYIVFGIFLSFTMPIVIIVNYSNTILGFFELAASVSRKYTIVHLTPLEANFVGFLASCWIFSIKVPNFCILQYVIKI